MSAGAVLTMQPALDTSAPNMARIYNHWLGGKDQISQVVPAVKNSGPTEAVQALQAYYSKTVSVAVRYQSGTSLGANVHFAGRMLLTLA